MYHSAEPSSCLELRQYFLFSSAIRHVEPMVYLGEKYFQIYVIWWYAGQEEWTRWFPQDSKVWWMCCSLSIQSSVDSSNSTQTPFLLSLLPQLAHARPFLQLRTCSRLSGAEQIDCNVSIQNCGPSNVATNCDDILLCLHDVNCQTCLQHHISLDTTTYKYNHARS